MAITDPNTVLILGAGVSAPFGIPLGGDLITLIARAIETERPRIYKKDPYPRNARTSFLYAAKDRDSYMQTPIFGALARKHLASDEKDIDWGGLQKDVERLDTMQQLLTNQTSETIDDFIVENPGYADLAKIAIAALILARCYRANDQNGIRTWCCQQFAARHCGPENERNWIHLLINVIRHGIRKSVVTAENKIRIVSFNYDRILEHVLEAQFSNTEAKHAHYSNFVEVLHVHGAFDPIEQERLNFPTQTLKWAQNIHVVNETTVPEELAQVRERARALIMSASEVYSAGFAFAGPNCQLINLDRWARAEGGRKYLRYCNYDGNVGVKRSAENLFRGVLPKRFEIDEAAGTPERRLSVSDWLKSGHLGELPG